MAKPNFYSVFYFIKKNIKRFGIFFAIALFFLIFSKLSLNYRQTIKVKISVLNLDDTIVIESDTADIINAYVEAKGFALLPFVFKPLKTIKLDAKDHLLKQKNTYVFDAIKNRFMIEEAFGESFKVLQLKPDSVNLKFTTLASKLVPLEIQTDVNFKTGFDTADDIKAAIDSVKIVGPTSLLNQIQQIKTQKLIKNKVADHITASLELLNPHPSKLQLFPKTVVVSANVERFTEGIIEVPIELINKPTKTTINYFPKHIKVTYYVPLQHYKSINASSFKVICDFNSISANKPYIVPTLVEKPTFVKHAHLKQHRVDFIKL